MEVVDKSTIKDIKSFCKDEKNADSWYWDDTSYLENQSTDNNNNKSSKSSWSEGNQNPKNIAIANNRKRDQVQVIW